MGRPPLNKDEESGGFYVRFPQSEREAFIHLAQLWEVSVPEVLRRLLYSLPRLEAELNQRDAELDELANQYLKASTTDQRADTYARLLIATAQTTTHESAVELFLRDCPYDINALLVRRLLEKYRRAKGRNPESVTDADLGRQIGIGRCSSFCQ